MVLYHGTNIGFETIDLSKYRPYKDFGQGFYLTDIEQQAIQMANRRCDFEDGGIPQILRFQFDESIITSSHLSCKVFDCVSVEWAQFIVSNRNRNIQYCHHYDIVVGPVADDGVVYQINRFLQGIIPLETLVKELEFKHLNNQYCFCTKKTISCLQKI